MCWGNITSVSLFSSEEEDEDDVGNEVAYDHVRKHSAEEVTVVVVGVVVFVVKCHHKMKMLGSTAGVIESPLLS